MTLLLTSVIKRNVFICKIWNCEVEKDDAQYNRRKLEQIKIECFAEKSLEFIMVRHSGNTVMTM